MKYCEESGKLSKEAIKFLESKRADEVRITEEEEIARFKKLMKEHGFKIDISGCGCCGSPVVEAWYKGERVLNVSEESIYMSHDDE